jgi:hypothetical protein
MQRASLVIGIVFLLFGGSHPALSTETAKSFELVAVYSKIQGIGVKYMTGASFTTIADCEAALTSVQHVVTNIQVQGIYMDGSLLFLCEDFSNKHIELWPKG